MNYSYLIKKTGIKTPLIGLYDTPDIKSFNKTVKPKVLGHTCLFAYYKHWLKGKTLILTNTNFGCGGAGYWLFGKENRSREDFVSFLVDDEGLKQNHQLMNKWLDKEKPYNQKHKYLAIGALKEEMIDYLKTVTFFVTPDQLSMLIVGAQYFHKHEDPAPIISPFGSGCMQLLSLFKDLEVPQALIGTTDMAMRKYLPSDIMAFTVTKSLFEQMCRIDNESFLEKHFIEGLKNTRKKQAEKIKTI